MFYRNISTNEIKEVLKTGQIIMNYPDDKPLPSKLLFSEINSRPLHIVCSYNSKTQTTIIITTYEPSIDIWKKDFKTRKK